MKMITHRPSQGKPFKLPRTNKGGAKGPQHMTNGPMSKKKAK